MGTHASSQTSTCRNTIINSFCRVIRRVPDSMDSMSFCCVHWWKQILPSWYRVPSITPHTHLLFLWREHCSWRTLFNSLCYHPWFCLNFWHGELLFTCQLLSSSFLSLSYTSSQVNSVNNSTRCLIISLARILVRNFPHDGIAPNSFS